MKPEKITVAKALSRLEGTHRPADVFNAFCKVAACALSAGFREEEYAEEIKRWPSGASDIFAEALAALIVDMEDHPFRDRLGPAYMELLSTSAAQWGGEFHTPAEVCELMAQMMIADQPPPTEGPIKLCEPACGAGAQILAAAHAIGPENVRRLRVLAVDVARTACDMCFINTTLWGIPTVVIHGNTLSGVEWAKWPNIHMRLAHPFTWPRVFAGAPAEREPAPAEVKVHVTPEQVAGLRADLRSCADQPADDGRDALLFAAAAIETLTPPSPASSPEIVVARRAARAKAENPSQLAFF